MADIHDLIARFKVDMGSFKSDMKSASGAVVDIKDEFKKAGVNGSGFEKNLDGVSGASSGLSGKLKGIATAAAGAFAVNAVKNFAVNAIEVTARLNAMESQFEQVFKDKEGEEMLNRLKKVSGDTVIQIDRLKSSANQFGAQFKGSGVEAKRALEMTETATRLAADSAAFYDRSMEDATGAVSSFMKGNFAAGDSIGVFTNANQMSGMAVEKFGKKWQDLTEAQKQDLLLQKIEETYKLNGAMGQASRESGAWENVMGNLKATWDRFLTVVGGPLLSAVIPVIKGITGGVASLQEYLSGFDFGFFTQIKENFVFLKDGISGAGDPEALEGLSAVFYNVGSTIKSAFDEIKSAYDSVLKPIFEAIGGLFGAVLDVVKDVWPSVSKIIGTAFTEVKGYYDEVLKPIWEMLSKALVGVIDTVKENFPVIGEIIKEALGKVQQVWDEVLKPVFDLIKSTVMEMLVPLFEEYFPIIQEAVASAFQGIKQLWDEVLSPALDDLIAFMRDVLVPWFEENFPKIKEIVANVFEGIKAFWEETLKPVFDAVVAFVRDTLLPIFQENFPIIQEVVKTVFDTIVNIWENALQPAFIAIKNFIAGVLMPAFDLAFPLIQKAVETAFKLIKFAWENVLKPAFDTLNSIILTVIKPAFEEVFPKVQKIVEDVFKAMKVIWETVLEPVFDAVTELILNRLKPAFESVFENIKLAVQNSFDAVSLAVDVVSRVFEGIKTTIDNVKSWFDGLKTGITDNINAARDAIGAGIDKIKGFFGFKFEWPKLSMPKFGITPQGWKIGDLLKGSIPKLGITWNADGAIFTKPTIFDTSSGLQGVGEAGPEAIMPIKQLPRLLAPYFERKGETRMSSERIQTSVIPLDLTVRLGKRAFKLHVDDVTREQDREVEGVLAYEL